MAEGMGLSELVVKYIFKADTAKLNDFIKGIGELNMGSIMAGIGIGALGETIALTSEEIGKMMKEGEGEAQWMKNFTAQTGVSAQAMMKWKDMAEELGISGQAIIGTITGIREAERRWSESPQIRTKFAFFGLSGREDPIVVLKRMIDVISKAPTQERKDWFIEQAKSLGYQVELARLLEMKESERAKLYERIETLSKGQVDALDKSAQASHRVQIAWSQISKDMASAMAPAFERVATKLAELLESIHRRGLGSNIIPAVAQMHQIAYPLGGQMAMIAESVGMTGGAKLAHSITHNNNVFNIYGPLEQIVSKIEDILARKIKEADMKGTRV